MNSSVIGGFYSNTFDGIIQLANETWHVEPTRKYGTSLIDAGPSIIYNTLDVDLTKYPFNSTFRYKRDVENEESSFCGLNDQLNRKEIERLSKSTRSKRGIFNQTCCSLYIRIDPTLWDIVYRNEGLYVSEESISNEIDCLFIGKRSDDSCSSDIFISNNKCSE